MFNRSAIPTAFMAVFITVGMAFGFNQLQLTSYSKIVGLSSVPFVTLFIFLLLMYRKVSKRKLILTQVPAE